MARKSSKSSSSETPETTKAPKAASPKKRAASTKASTSAGAKSDPSVNDAPVPPGSRGRSLVIVESPKKAKSINKFLGSKFIVKASLGHVRDLPKHKLGLDVIRGYAPSYEIMDKKKDTIAELKREAAQGRHRLSRD